MPCFLSTKKQDCIVQQAVFRNCPKKNNSHDCGLFAVAVIWHLLEGKEIHSSVFTQDHIGALREALCRGLLPNAEWATLESVSSFFPALLPPLRNEPSPDQDGALAHETGPEVEEPKEDEEVVVETHPENLIHDVEDEIFARKFSEPSQVFQTVEELMVVINDYQETSGNFLAIRRSPSDNRIQRVFVCPSFANDVLMCVRPVISIDGAHMRSEWKGTLYLATVKSVVIGGYSL
ncbi:hypothetical protein IV203_024962 [Nitzschia inconspicua]|uniref:Uncharacterized protein n=1 Tax=Nitzschia inconspicua TaxID=303405 RepID=A0A9K3PA52_9STRA|nr:hypothetical protein IV203_024962 [Nitzschia inconspicua]